MTYTYNFDEIRERKNTAKWARARAIGAIGMGIADMDFRLAPEIVEAIKERAECGEFGYTAMETPDYEAVLDWLTYRGAAPVPRAHLVGTPGVLYAARNGMYTVTSPGDKVIVQTPLHTPSIATAAMQGRIPLVNRLVYRDGRYEIDFNDLEDRFREGARVLMMCAPNNPTGRVWTREELESIATLVNRYDAYVVCDEIHRDIIWGDHRHLSPTAVPSLAERSIAVFSTSKTFNMGGFHVGSAIIPNEELRTRFVKQFYSIGHACVRPSSLDLAAQTAAYTKGRAWYEQMMAYVDENFTVALEHLDGLPIRATHPEGTFLLWVDISELGLYTQELREVMSEKWRVLGDVGLLYDTAEYQNKNELEHHVRLNLATPRANVIEAFDRIRRYFKS
ncbi:MAG: aminotransferase class I/II-fold pyridoxal phosphate-dependent enzyme [Clostridia bacterium]|nr:aminotransferase class I/II-fold pyridoxal phosphate-dependent enzyme [Clostridia bacterium]